MDDAAVEEKDMELTGSSVLTIQVIGHRFTDGDILTIEGVAQEGGEWPEVLVFGGKNWRLQDVDDEFGDNEEDDSGNKFSQELADYVQD